MEMKRLFLIAMLFVPVVFSNNYDSIKIIDSDIELGIRILCINEYVFIESLSNKNSLVQMMIQSPATSPHAPMKPMTCERYILRKIRQEFEASKDQ